MSETKEKQLSIKVDKNMYEELKNHIPASAENGEIKDIPSLTRHLYQEYFIFKQQQDKTLSTETF